MFGRVFIFCSCLFVLFGCAYDDEPMPEITYDYPENSSVVRVIQSGLSKATGSRGDVDENIPGNWVPPSRAERIWTAVVIHHSGTKNGDATIFDKWHREGNYWEGVGYDFVIGNGTDSGDGQVEVTFRWRNQVTGAHCGGTPGNWANVRAVGICLVGDFMKAAPTGRQIQSLVKLIRFLQKRYNIPKIRIYGHGDTPGYTGGSLCPGRYFPMARLKLMLEF